MHKRLRSEWTAPLALALLVLLAALPLLTWPLGRDQGMYANIGRSILAGGTPYLDMWDIKPPPIYYLYAASIGLFGPSSAAVRALDLLLIPPALLALAWLGRRLATPGAGLLALLFLGVFYYTETFASLSQSDSLVLLPMTLAACAAYAAARAPRASRAALIGSGLAGLLCGLILWFKHYYVFFVLALVIHQLWARRALPWREAFAFAAGGLLTGGTLLLYFLSNGMLAEMLIVAQGTAAYNAQGYDLATFVASMAHYLGFRWLHWGPLLIFAALWLPFGPRGAGWRLVWLWLLAGLTFALIQAKGFDTHWLPMLPPLALLAGSSAAQVIARLGRAQRPAGLLFSLGLLGILIYNIWLPALPYALGQMTQRDYYARFTAGDFRPAETLDVLEYLRPRIAPGDTIFVWGFRPEIAFLGGWRPATRFQAQFPLVAPWYPADWKDENVAQLWAAMPPYALVLQNDYMPWVTSYDADSNVLLQDYTELNNWLIANYARETKIGNFFVWQRQRP